MRRSAAFASFLKDRDRQARAFARGQQLRNAWLDTQDAALLSSTMERLAARPPADVAAFTALLDPVINDSGWVRRLIDCWVDALREDMFADLPWQTQQTAAMCGLTLMQKGRVSCSLIVADGDALSTLPQDRVTFDNGMTCLWILKGALRMRQFRRDAAGQTIDRGVERNVRAGERLATDCARRQWVMTGADGDCVMVRISLADGAVVAPICEYSTVTGQLMRRGCGDGGTSRMLALLDVAAHARPAELLPVLHDLSRHPDAVLRWQAMRLWIVGDPGSALPQLAAMATDDPDGEVRSVAMLTLPMVEQALAAACPGSVAESA